MSDLYMSYKTLEANEKHFKTCIKCGETLPATTEYFHKKKTGKYGLRSECKKCIKEYQKQYREDNKDKIAEYMKQWYEDNKDKIAERSKQYYENNKDKIAKRHKQYYENNKDKKAEYGKQYYENNKDKHSEYMKQWYEDNKDKIAERSKQWYENNKDKIAEQQKQYRENNKDKIAKYGKQYRKDNKDKIAEYQKQYRATPQGQASEFNRSCRRRTKKQNQGNGITSEQWLECMKFFGFRCAYSGQVLSKDTRSLDHVKPLNQGGKHEIWNCVPMDRGLNSSKNDKGLLEWYQGQDFYSEERLQKIYEWQEYAYNKYSKK